MKHFGQIKALMVTGAMALGGLALAAAPAHAATGSAGISAVVRPVPPNPAPPPHTPPGSETISAASGAGVLEVTGSGFTTGATVDLNVLVDNTSAGGGPGDIGAALTSTETTTVQAGGSISYPFYGLNNNGVPYSGPVLVEANPVGPGSTVWTQSAVILPPFFSSTFTEQFFAGDPITVLAYDFDPGTSVQLNLWTTGQNYRLLSTTTVPVESDGQIYMEGALPTDGYTGSVWIQAIQSPDYATGVPAPPDVWFNLTVH
jgi:hypothetical protein